MSALRLSGLGALLALLTGLASSVQAQTVVRYVHTDALGSVVALTDQSRNVIERREYEPYGAQLTPALQDGPGYTGHVMDAATGLSYMQQRYYDPQLGRFLSVDPVTANSNTGGNFNRYWYANNNPYKFTDPDGRQPFCNGSRILSACGGGGVAGMQTSARSIGSNAGNRLTGRPNAASAGSKTFGPLRSGYIPAVSGPTQPSVGGEPAPQGTYSLTSNALSNPEVNVSFVAASGLGITGQKGVNNSGDKVGLVVVGYGLKASADVNVAKLSYTVPGRSSSSTSASGGFDFDIYAGWGGSISYQTTNGGWTLSLDTGPGIGAAFKGVSVDKELGD